MKKWMFLSLFFVLPVMATGSKADVSRQLESFLAGATINDPQQHDLFWADELVYTSSTGVRFGKQALMEGVNQAGKLASQDIDTVYSAQDVNIRIFGDMALLDFTLVGTDSGQQQQTQYYLNSGVLVWRDDRWQVVNWHATKKADAS